MIALVALLACILSAYFGYQIGLFRASMALAAALLGGLAAFNWGVPTSRALAPDVPGTATLVVIFGFLAAAGVLLFVAFRLAPMPLRMPWLLDDLGGAVLGALLGWIVVGVLLASARFSPDIDGWIRRTRGVDHAAKSTPDGFWFGVLSATSDGGLQRSPKRPFTIEGDLPPTRQT